MQKLKISNFLMRLNIKSLVNVFSNILFLFVIGFGILLIISLIYTEKDDFSLINKILGVSHTKGIKLSFLLLFIIFCLKNMEDLILKPSYFDNHLKSNVILIQVINFLLFIVISYYFFSSFPNLIFTGVDGDYMLSLEKTQFIWNKNILEFSSNFLQGLGGNIIFPFNTNIDLGYLSSRISSNNFNSIFAHTTWSSLLFLSVLFFSRIIQLPSSLGIVSAWLVPILILFPQPFRFYPVAALVPHTATIISLFLMISGIILWKNNIKGYLIIKVIFLLICIEYLLIYSPAQTLILFPILAIFLIIKISLVETYKQKLIEIFIYLIILIFLFTSGGFSFLLGLFVDTAANLYSDQLVTNHRGSLIFASTFFYGYGFLTIPVGILGLISIVSNKNLPLILRRVSLVCLFYIITIFIFGFLNYINPKLIKIPSPVYFEFFLWPIYCIGIANFTTNFINLVQLNYKKYFLKIISNISTYLILVGFFSLGLLVYPIFNSTTKREWLFPSTSSNIIKFLEKSLSHQPGDNFKGRVATFTGMKIPGKLGWENLQDLDYKLLNIFGSDYRKADLWFRSIPTLTEYSSHISPRFYFFSTLFLSRKGDFQVRAMMTLRNINPEILKIMGFIAELFIHFKHKKMFPVLFAHALLFLKKAQI